MQTDKHRNYLHIPIFLQIYSNTQSISLYNFNQKGRIFDKMIDFIILRIYNNFINFF